MPRYINVDKLLERLDSCRCDHCTNDKSEGCALCQYDDFKKAIQNAPAADVVPESEVERLKTICNSYALQYGTVRDQQKVIDKAKAEVVMEIEREIEKFERDATKCIEEYKSPAAKPFVDLCEGKLVGLNEARQVVAVFKKKYAEGEWIVTENGCVITCSECGYRLELCYPDGTEVRSLPACPNCGTKMRK